MGEPKKQTISPYTSSPPVTNQQALADSDSSSNFAAVDEALKAMGSPGVNLSLQSLLHGGVPTAAGIGATTGSAFSRAAGEAAGRDAGGHLNDDPTKEGSERLKPATGYILDSKVGAVGDAQRPLDVPGYFKTKKGNAPARFVGTLTPGLTQQEQLDQYNAENAVTALKVGQGEAMMKAALVSKNAFMNFAYVAHNNATAAMRLVDEEFPKYFKKMADFDKTIEDIRAMRVNPYQYLQHAGVGGRAGAVLATMVSQISAGSGNIGTAVSALSNAIAMDVEAQAMNIEIQFKAAQMAKDNIRDQIALMEESLLFRDKAQAYAFAACESIVRAAQSQATSDVTQMGNEMIIHELTLRRIASQAEARAKAGTIYVDIPVANAASAARAANTSASMHEALRRQFQTGMFSTAPIGTQQPQQVPAQTGTGAKTGTGTRRPSLTTRQPTVTGTKPVPTMMQEANPPVEAPMQYAGEDQVTSSVQQGKPPAKVGENSVLATPELQEQYKAEEMEREATLSKLRSPEYMSKYGDALFRQSTKAYGLSEGDVMAKGVAKLGSVSKLTAGLLGDAPALFPTHEEVWGDWFTQDDPARMLKYFQNPPREGYDEQGFPKLGNAMFSNIIDAKILAGGIRRTILPHMKSGKAKDWLKYAVDHEDVFLQDQAVLEDKKAHVDNFIDTGFMGRLRFTLSGKAYRDEVAEDLSNVQQTVGAAADAIARVEATPFTRNSVVTLVEGDVKWFPTFDKDAVAARQGQDEALTGMAIRWIKSRDPAGRLSDQDIKLAKEMISAAMTGRVLKISDLVGSFGGDVSEVRKGVIMFLKTMAQREIESFETKHGNKFVLPYETFMQKREQEQELRRLITKRVKEQSKNPIYTWKEHSKYGGVSQ